MSIKPKERSQGMAFEVKVDGDCITPRSRKPKHLQERLGETERPTTPDSIAIRQKRAEERRQAQEQERLQKVQEHLNKVEKVVAESESRKQQQKDGESQQ